MNPLWNHPEPKLIPTTDPRASSWFPSFKVPKSSCATCHVDNSHSPPYVSILGFLVRMINFSPWFPNKKVWLKSICSEPLARWLFFKIRTIYFFGVDMLGKTCQWCLKAQPYFTGWWFQTHLKNMSQNGNLHQIGVKIKIVWTHHLV